MKNEISCNSPTSTENILNNILADQCLSSLTLNGTDLCNNETVVGSTPWKSAYNKVMFVSDKMPIKILI